MIFGGRCIPPCPSRNFDPRCSRSTEKHGSEVAAWINYLLENSAIRQSQIVVNFINLEANVAPLHFVMTKCLDEESPSDSVSTLRNPSNSIGEMDVRCRVEVLYTHFVLFLDGRYVRLQHCR